ncbi:hypothetical protein K0M31_004583 [Melipona bicolor]|uniref:Uncharacterized protein n=1 Tax=Melipona bicolor TaxID=60889 RepID=A0AA40FX32_9HYME|nr:hypothetical protein K0M31_004583 [Melipona bicolor]
MTSETYSYSIPCNEQPSRPINPCYGTAAPSKVAKRGHVVSDYRPVADISAGAASTSSGVASDDDDDERDKSRFVAAPGK